jgi:hypothetical protein
VIRLKQTVPESTFYHVKQFGGSDPEMFYLTMPAKQDV